MDYWKLLTEGPLHASEEAEAADQRHDSSSRLLRCSLPLFVLINMQQWSLVRIHRFAVRARSSSFDIPRLDSGLCNSFII